MNLEDMDREEEAKRKAKPLPPEFQQHQTTVMGPVRPPGNSRAIANKLTDPNWSSHKHLCYNCREKMAHTERDCLSPSTCECPCWQWRDAFNGMGIN